MHRRHRVQGEDGRARTSRCLRPSLVVWAVCVLTAVVAMPAVVVWSSSPQRPGQPQSHHGGVDVAADPRRARGGDPDTATVSRSPVRPSHAHGRHKDADADADADAEGSEQGAHFAGASGGSGSEAAGHSGHAHARGTGVAADDALAGHSSHGDKHHKGHKGQNGRTTPPGVSNHTPIDTLSKRNSDESRDNAPVLYASATKAERLEVYGKFRLADHPWHWGDFEMAGTLGELLKPDPGPSWRGPFDAAASYDLPPRDGLASPIFVRLAAHLGEVVPDEPAAEVFPGGAPKSMTETLQCLALLLLRTRCLVLGEEQCGMHPAVPSNASLEWQFVHGQETYFDVQEDAPGGGLMLLATTRGPFEDFHPDVKARTVKHMAPMIVDAEFSSLAPPIGRGRRVFLNIVRAPLLRAVSNKFHGDRTNHKPVEKTMAEIRKGTHHLDLMPVDMAPAYSKGGTPLDVRRRTYYMQAEVLLDPEYRPHVLSDMARFMLGSGADERVVRQAVGMLVQFEAPRMDHGISHPPFTELITEEGLRGLREQMHKVPEVVRRMYPMPETMAGPFEMRLCNINEYLWELEGEISCDPFGVYA